MISCDVCLDLIPLVQDGVASDDSIALVTEHISHCDSCRDVYEGKEMNINPSDNTISKAKKYLNTFMLMIMILGIFFGLSLSYGVDMFLNITLMPILGCIGFYLFHYKSFYILPTLLLFINTLISLFKVLLGLQDTLFLDIIYLTILYSIFVTIGNIIASLLNYAFRKD